MVTLRVHSRRYAGRMVRVGRLLVVFHGEHAEIPGWAEREYRHMLAHIPGISPAPASASAPSASSEPPAEPEAIAVTAPPTDPAPEPAAGAPATADPTWADSTTLRIRTRRAR